MLVLLLLGLYRPKPGCSRCDDYSEDNGTCTAGKLCQRLHVCCCEAGDEACDYNSENDTAFACRGHDDSKEHAKQCYTQCTDNAFWQRCTGDNAAGCANRPARNCYGHAAIVIVWIQNTGTGDSDTEKLIRYSEGHSQTMYKALRVAEPLAQRAAHQHVACIGDKGDQCYFGIAGILADEGNGGKFTG